ncbi:MAG TPA: pitrilysin family protein [Anaerolineaceae bacterium]|nr:pitrilysin family protein [Anaerolineaceae bacterium]
MQTRLDNGLQIYLKEIHTIPLVSHWVWYRVGSRDEVPGMRGISHWVEHMLFKGTPRFPGRELDRVISREGGVWNAFTYLDWTTFFETMPADKIGIGLQLEADRMQNASFDPVEVESERTVILSEMDGRRNEPMQLLGEAVQQAAFDIHPYRHEVIGEENDLKILSREDLYQHYRRYYHPQNAVVAVAGDFDTEQMLAELQALYASIPPGPEPDRPAVVEGPLNHERRVEVKGPGTTTYLEIAYRAPSAAGPDFFAFAVLDSLLSGPMSLNMFGGGGVSNKTTRLYRALVETDLAASVYGGLQATIDPFLYHVVCTVNPDRKYTTVLSGIDAQIRRLQDEPVSEAEIARAIKQTRAIFAYGSENITNQAFWLGYSEMFASYDWFVDYIGRLMAVTPEDVMRIAQVYLADDRRVVGVYLPTGNGADES